MSDVPTLYAIDFGTSNSLVAAANEERVFEPVPLDPEAADPTILRSILCFLDAGGVFVGSEALRKFIEHGAEGRLLRSIKHHLGSRSFRGTIIRGRMVSAEELVAFAAAPDETPGGRALRDRGPARPARAPGPLRRRGRRLR